MIKNVLIEVVCKIFHASVEYSLSAL